MGELQEAIQTLQMAMILPGVRRAGASAKSKNKKVELSSADCVSVFLELAEALWLNGEQVRDHGENKLNNREYYSIYLELCLPFKELCTFQELMKCRSSIFYCTYIPGKCLSILFCLSHVVAQC